MPALINISFLKNNGYQIVKGLIPTETIAEARDFLQEEAGKQMETLRQKISFSDTDELIDKTGKIVQDPTLFNQYDEQTRNLLTGHFPVEVRLSEKILAIIKLKQVQTLISNIFETQDICMHMPPTTRFILPRNIHAGVPPHQDISYNKHIENFVVLWCPLVDIDDECGGVVVHHGSGFIDEQLKSFERKFWLKGIQDMGYKKVHCKMKVGDALILNPYIVHESKGNSSNKTRFSIDFRFFPKSVNSTKYFLDCKTNKVINGA